MEEPRQDEPAATPRGFWGLIGLQFQGALSDNLFKQLLVLVVLARFADDARLAGRWTAIIMILFSLPYLIFSGLTGTLADRFSKRVVTLGTKAAEILIMALGGVALYLYTGRATPFGWAFYAAVGVLFLMATQSTFFSPAKYGILPEILPLRRLAWGNGLMEGSTYLAIIAGIAAGNVLYKTFDDGLHLERASMILVALALLGLGAGWFIPRVAAARPDQPLRLNHFPQLWEYARMVMNDRQLFLAVAGVAYIWSLGAMIVANVPIWGQHHLGLSIPAAGMLVAVFGLGIGLGSAAVGLLSRRGLELGFVPIGALGVTLFTFLLALARPDTPPEGAAPPAAALLGLMGTFLALAGATGAFFGIPLNALVQQRAPAHARGGVIAALNFATFSGIILSNALFWVLIDLLKFSAGHIFAVISLATFGATVFLMTLLPEALLGLVSVLITRVLFRVRIIGEGRIPAHGPALIVSNHISMVDALLIRAVSPRPIRFLVWKEIFDNPLVGYFLKIMNAIPVSSDQRPRALIASLTRAAEALKAGELVCTFTDGGVTRPGLPLPAQRGFRYVLDKAPVPIVPINLDGVWGSIFSYEKKRFIWSWPREIPYRVRVAIGRSLPPNATKHQLRQAVQALGADCAIAKAERARPLHHRFVRYARRHWRQFCVADATTEPLKFGRTLIGAIVLARRLRRFWGDQTMVGVYLPPSVGAVLANAAATLSGRTTVNLNYTSGPQVLRHCIEQCNLRTIVTARIFLERLGQEPPRGAVFLDDLRKQKPRLTEMIGGLLAARYLPIGLLERYCGARGRPAAGDLATVIFSSGSTGVPKGVMLTHFNVGANIESFEQAVSLWPDDRIIGFLPFFHSFGYTTTLWGALHIGYGVIHHPNPLEAKAIGDLVEKYGVTVLIGTPTFLQQYIRRVEPKKFRSLEFVLTGAEKMPLRVAEGFEEKFGVYVHEGYGTTECAPVVSTNVDEYRSKGHHTIGNRRGSVGHPVPGVALKITDPETGEELAEGRPGMIHVRGPNIMKGYLSLPEKTAAVLKDGWYETGDIGLIDEDGFLLITDRLARFSKIGGEMVPHVRIEEELHRAVGAADQVFAVTSVEDPYRGERLVVLTTLAELALDDLINHLADAGLPNLWIPRKNMFFRVEAFPILGTGKLNLSEVRQLARRLVEQKESPIDIAVEDEPDAAESAPAPSAGSDV